MKCLWLIIFFLSCKAPQPTVMRQADFVFSMTGPEQTAAIIKNQLEIERNKAATDSNRAAIDSLKSFIAYPDTNIFVMKGNVMALRDTMFFKNGFVVMADRYVFLKMPDTTAPLPIDTTSLPPLDTLNIRL